MNLGVFCLVLACITAGRVSPLRFLIPLTCIPHNPVPPAHLELDAKHDYHSSGILELMLAQFVQCVYPDGNRYRATLSTPCLALHVTSYNLLR